jgi:hypothetical protein
MFMDRDAFFIGNEWVASSARSSPLHVARPRAKH